MSARLSEQEIATLADLTLRERHEWARARGIRLARTPASDRLGCVGCQDGDNVRHPGMLWRCETCPVIVVRQTLTFNSSRPTLPGQSTQRTHHRRLD